jgi:general secretion pathway protein M
VQFAGERATVTLRAVPSAALAGWLVDLRANARLLPAEVHLAKPVGADAADRWDGSVVLNLPQR